jgi:hypothetical protein
MIYVIGSKALLIEKIRIPVPTKSNIKRCNRKKKINCIEWSKDYNLKNDVVNQNKKYIRGWTKKIILEGEIEIKNNFNKRKGKSKEREPNWNK